jgi:isopenicillin-N N-acyltransferase-like protein
MRTAAQLAVGLLCSCAAAVLGAECNGHSTPGGRNLIPIDSAPPRFVRAVPNGKLFTIGTGDDTKTLIHLWGSPYENGVAMGTLLGPKMPAFIKEVYQYTETQIVAQAANNTFLAEVVKMGLTVALNLSYYQTAPYIKPYVMEELRGLADASGGTVSLVDIRNVMWLGEITRGSCSMFGAWGSATQRSRGGKLLQLRALDWDTTGPFKNYAAVTVYHPRAGEGHAWANVGFGAWTGSITGFSSQQIALSEIGVSYPDATFGPETYLAKGYPFSFLIRDILQFDRTLEAATQRITGAKRTCDLILGVGDGKVRPNAIATPRPADRARDGWMDHPPPGYVWRWSG